MVAPHGLSLLISIPAPDVAASLANLLEPFGNRVVIASAAEAAARASQENFDAMIAGPDEADLLAAARASRAPIVAVLLRGDRAPGGHGLCAALAGGGRCSVPHAEFDLRRAAAGSHEAAARPLQSTRWLSPRWRNRWD